MNFLDERFRGAMLVMLNGEGGQPNYPCAKCGKPMLRVYITARARQMDPALAPHQDVCITAKGGSLGGLGPCWEALKAKDLIDRLMEASRR